MDSSESGCSIMFVSGSEAAESRVASVEDDVVIDVLGGGFNLGRLTCHYTLIIRYMVIGAIRLCQSLFVLRSRAG